MNWPRSSDPGVLGVVLAAGWGRRMGGPKALLRMPEGGTFLETVAGNVRGSGVMRTVVVVGPWWGDARAPEGCEILVNPDPDRGVISSLRLALGGSPRCDVGVLMALVDHPAVRPNTYRMLIEGNRTDPRRIAIPVLSGPTGRRRGHPVVFPAWLIPEFFGPMADREGPRSVIHAHPEAVREIEVSDPGIILDINTPECYQRLSRWQSGP